MGDEGKGRVVHEIMDEIQEKYNCPVECVMKVNGGANAGHTAAGLKLNLLPSGISNPKVPNLLIGSGVVADPRKFHWEGKPLEAKGISVFKRLKIDNKCQVSDVTHRLLDLAWENYRIKHLGEPKRGSTGRGISPAYCDETGQWQIYYSIFKKDRKEFSKKIGEKIERAQDTIKHVCQADESDWYNFFKILTEAEIKANSDSIKDGCFEKSEFMFETFSTSKPFLLNTELIEEVYWKAGRELIECIVDGREILLNNIEKKKHIVAEFGQAYWLDKRHGFTPNVTASHTFGAEFFMSGGIPLRKINQIGCCKAYDTKVGTHHFITKIDHNNDPLGERLAKIEFGTSTGRQRMVGWFDSVEKGIALRYGGFDELVINKLDALSCPSLDIQLLKICTAYKLIDGSIIKEVPQDDEIRKSIVPVYESLESWSENLQSCKSFNDFPINAKKYVAKMVSSIIQVAYPRGYSSKILPRIKFIGVGPDPKQIIRDIPTTEILIENY